VAGADSVNHRSQALTSFVPGQVILLLVSVRRTWQGEPAIGLAEGARRWLNPALLHLRGVNHMHKLTIGDVTITSIIERVR
jgi:hypothetical protein